MKDRIAQLEARLHVLEDEREIAQLIAAYGPLVDSGDAEAIADLWEPEGIYDVDEAYLAGRSQLIAMVNSRGHRQWIDGGCAHFLGPARITVRGDDAVAICHSLMVVRQEAQFIVRRATANHWELRRTDDGWRVATRTSRVLDGRPESPELLRLGAHGLPC